MNVLQIFALRRDERVSCNISYSFDKGLDSYRMNMEVTGLPAGEFVNRDVFACLCDAREFLRGHDTALLCNGARLDAYPSRMSRQMGGGRKVYITTLGQQTGEDDLVDSFGEAPADKIASVERQKDFHDDWLRSLGWVIIKCKLRFAGPQGVAPCRVEVVGTRSSSRPLSIIFYADDMDAIEAQGGDLFDCLKAVRLVLEGRAIVLLCNGARIDSYPTQADRQTDYGRNIHIAELGKPTTEACSVDIFADAPIDKVGSVAAQQAYHEEWLRSLDQVS